MKSQRIPTFLPSYQFFSADLNYNYFTEQTPVGDAPGAVTPAVVTKSVVTQPVVTKSMATPSVVIPSPVTQSVVPYTPASYDFISNLAAPAAAPVVEVEPARVEYSLSDDEPELTFEERVAAMEREMAIADAASAAARAAADAIARASAAATQPISPIPTFSRYDVELIPAEYLQAPVAPAPAPAPAALGTQSGEKWNAYVQPNCAPDVFSADFNFNRSLLKIFWRIDVDHNNRVSKNELALALQENWFAGDEKLLAKLLFEMYEDISPEAIFCDAGLSVNNILSYGPFGDMAKEELEAVIPEPIPQRNEPPKKKNINKQSKSLRSMFK